MIHYPSPDHVHVKVDDTAQQMLAIFYRRRVIPILPERPSPPLPVVIFLATPASNKLHRPRNHLTTAPIVHEQVNVIRRNHVVQIPPDRITVLPPGAAQSTIFDPLQTSGGTLSYDSGA
jgi:hypothetical protein